MKSRISCPVDQNGERWFAPSLTDQTQPSCTMTAQCWKATTSVLPTASCRTTMKWTSSTTSPKTTGGRWDWQRAAQPGSRLLFCTKRVRLASMSLNLMDLWYKQEDLLFFPHSITAAYFSSCLVVLPGSWGLWWWRWCWPQICRATSSRWRPWRTSCNSLRGEFHLRSLTIKGSLPFGPSVL